MKLKEFTLLIFVMMGFAIVMVFFFYVFDGIIRHTDSYEVCKNLIGNHPSKVNPNGRIAENGGGGTLCTTNLGISARLDRIEKRLDALSNRLESFERRTPPSP